MRAPRLLHRWRVIEAAERVDERAAQSQRRERVVGGVRPAQAVELRRKLRPCPSAQRRLGRRPVERLVELMEALDDQQPLAGRALCG